MEEHRKKVNRFEGNTTVVDACKHLGRVDASR